VGRPLRIGIARLNKAIAEYSLARLEFTLQHPEQAAPPLLQRMGASAADEPAFQNWAEMMRRIAVLQQFIESAKGADESLALDTAFERLTRAANHVAVLAWSMESMHRRRHGGAIG